MKIALGQMNPTVGALAANADRMLRFGQDAAARGADVLVLPELALCGYPPRDLVEKTSFLDGCQREIERLAAATAALPLAIIAGTVVRSARSSGKQAANAAVVLQGGKVIFRQHKMLLPTYDVFDESRYFVSAERQLPATIHGENVALTICEDAWNDRGYWERPLYQRDPVEELMEGGASMLISINGSPYNQGKRQQRREMFRALARRHRVPVVYVNQVGGNDQLVFDGSSFCLNSKGELIAEAKSFAEDLVFADIDGGAGRFAYEPRKRNRCRLRSARVGNRRLSPQVRLQESAHRSLGRNRFLHHRRHRRRCHRQGKRHRCRHARSVFVGS